MSSTGIAATSLLARYAQRRPTETAAERCELCATTLPDDHPHLLDLEHKVALCACRACAVLFDRSGAGGHRLRRIPDRRLRLELEGDDRVTALFTVPVDLAYFVDDSGGDHISAYYPSPVGMTRGAIPPADWHELVAIGPAIATLEPDVEALLVRRTDSGDIYFIVPIDDCFRLAGLLRTTWRGWSGGRAVWSELDQFFDGLTTRSRTPRTLNARRS
jgi:hypothetical protein